MFNINKVQLRIDTVELDIGIIQLENIANAFNLDVGMVAPETVKATRYTVEDHGMPVLLNNAID